MSKVAVETHLAPPPRIGIYSQAIVAAGLVFCSGSLPADTTGAIIEGDIKIRTVRILCILQHDFHTKWACPASI
jgi:2-iminobutanoate/2-iminopropanoate deaminase